MLFFLIGCVSATEIDNVTSTESLDLTDGGDTLSLSDSNLIQLEKVQSEDNGNTLKTSADDLQTATKKVSSNQSSTTLTFFNPRYSQSNTIIKVALKDENSTGIADKALTLKISGKTYNSTTGSGGTAYFTVPSFKVGTEISATAKFIGDEQYAASSLTKTIKVVSSISATNLVETYLEYKPYSVRFLKDNGNLANSDVKFTVDGTTYTVKTDSNGYANITPELKAGEYTIKIYNPYSKETVSKTITVNKATPKITGPHVYLLPNTKYTYTATLKNQNGGVKKNATLYFTLNSKTESKKTDSNGQATKDIPALSKGTYSLKIQFKGDKNYNAVTYYKKIYVKESTTVLKSSTLNMQYNDGSKYSVKATTSDGKALANKTIKFTLNKKTTSVTTDSNGVAKLDIGDLAPNTYTVTATYSTLGLEDYNVNNGKVIISKQNVTITANDLVMKFNDGSKYQAKITNKTGSNLKDIEVQFTIAGKTTKAITDANGIAKIDITEPIGYYPIDIKVTDTTCYTSSKVTKNILVNGTKFLASDMTISADTAADFKVQLIDGLSKGVAGKTVTFTLNNKKQSVQTDVNGFATLKISGLSKGTYDVTYTDGSATGSSKITVTNKITLKEIITASQNVKKYIENSEELPKTVTIAGIAYSLADYLYLACQAIINLKNNNKDDIAVNHVNDPENPGIASYLGNLYDYLSVAKSVVNTANSKGIMPNSVSSTLGTIGYNGWVYAAARVVAYYGDNSFLPNYVTIKAYDTSTSSPLNTKNTIKDLKPYLAVSTNCQVNNTKFKTLVASLTEGLTTAKAKATAIYNYVRDYISYSFYYNTRYGALGTLNARTGNCVDQAHLLVALYRTAGLPARYVHGTCTFSDGTFGHVWTQVLIGDTWVVGDPTSTRNSFGNVVSWNNYNYQLHGYYASISF